MNKSAANTEDEDELRPEYDLSKLRLVGRGIYAERFRAGVKFSVLNDKTVVEENDAKEDNLNESGNISNSTERRTC